MGHMKSSLFSSALNLASCRLKQPTHRIVLSGPEESASLWDTYVQKVCALDEQLMRVELPSPSLTECSSLSLHVLLLLFVVVIIFLEGKNVKSHRTREEDVRRKLLLS